MTPLSSMISRAALPAVCLLVSAYFISHATVGGSGLFDLSGIRAEQAAQQARNDDLRRQREDMRHRIALLEPSRVDPDYADELVRQQLGVVRPDEVIVPMEPTR